MAKKTKRQKKHADELRIYSKHNRVEEQQTREMDSEIVQVAKQITTGYIYRNVKNELSVSKEEKIANELFPFVRHDLLRTLLFTGIALGLLIVVSIVL